MDLELLRDVRKNPRKMQASYLKKADLLDRIHEMVPCDWIIKDKIDVILKNTFDKCYCGNLSKAFSQWCSITCKNKDPDSRKNISFKNSANSTERLTKAKQTRIERYGVEAVQSIPSAKLKTRESKQKYYDSVIDSTFDRYGLDRTLLSDHKYLNSICAERCLFDVQREHFKSMPITTLTSHFSRIGFDPGFKRGSTSRGEQEIYTWLKESCEYDVMNNHRKTIGKELDVYIPEKNLAIEYHGLFWHSLETLEDKSVVNAKNHHRRKYELCKEKGIDLLQFFEDEWFSKKEIVKSIILSKLGIYEKRVYARNTHISQINRATAEEFFDTNHLQGKAIGKHYGMYCGLDLVAAMTVGKSRFDDTHELIRFATKTNCQVVGGFSKLLKHCKAELKVESLTTYADLRYSNGKTYSKFGKFMKYTSPGYFWVDRSKNIRLNRFNTQKHKLHTLLGSRFDSSKTEVENMESAGYFKIYDCGNAVYKI
jgi:hypothetical protein